MPIVSNAHYAQMYANAIFFFVISTSSGAWMGLADPRALFTVRRVRSSHDDILRHHSLLPTALCLLEAFFARK